MPLSNMCILLHVVRTHNSYNNSCMFQQSEIMIMLVCFERNLHTQISNGDSILSTNFGGNHVFGTTFCFMTHYDITINNNIARDVHCDIIIGHDVVMGTYHDVKMHIHVVRALIYYVLLRPIVIFLFS